MKKLIVLTVVVALSLPYSLHASQIILDSCRADRMAQDAQDIFCGICNGAKIESAVGHSALSKTMTVYTFSVTGEVAKGSYKTGDTVTFTANNLKDMPSFICNGKHEYCILLSAESKSGFRSPVNLSCGKYDVSKDSEGVTRVKSLVPRSVLFKSPVLRSSQITKSLNVRQKQIVTNPDVKEDMSRDDFMTIMKTIVSEQKKEGGK